MTYVWNDSKTKQICREKIIELANTHLNDIWRVFTLPSEEAICAKMFRTAWPSTMIVGVERSKNIFDKIDRSIIIDLYRCSLKQYIKQLTSKSRSKIYVDHTNVAFFDLVGPATTYNIDDITKFITNNNIIHKRNKSLIAITFNSTWRNASTEQNITNAMDELWVEEGTVPAYNKETASELVLTDIRKKLSKQKDKARQLSVIHSETYKAHSNSIPMFFIVLLVEKY